jgi:hypothetical protein
VAVQEVLVVQVQDRPEGGLHEPEGDKHRQPLAVSDLDRVFQRRTEAHCDCCIQ